MPRSSSVTSLTSIQCIDDNININMPDNTAPPVSIHSMNVSHKKRLSFPSDDNYIGLNRIGANTFADIC